jgi:hypothetical protein
VDSRFVDALCQEQGRAGVPEVVEAKVGQPSTSEAPLKVAPT